jgi:LPXTG-site transpeptidase (sortase) family protein
MRARLEAFWGRATPLQRALVAGVPAVVIALGAVGVMYASFSGGDEDKQVIAPTATKAPPTATKAPPTSTAVPPTATPEPVSAGLQDDGTTYDSTSDYSSGDTGGGGGGGGAAIRSDAVQTGPGPITGTDMTLSIPKIGVNAAVSGRTVGTSGQMGDPSGAYMVVWYDFNSHIGLGGRPGDPGANIVMAGHVDYIGVGPAVFWGIRDLVPGDVVTIYSATGTYNYAVQWAHWVEPYEDFTSYVAQQGVESVTLVTCIGGFSGGHYSNRIAVRATRI